MTSKAHHNRVTLMSVSPGYRIWRHSPRIWTREAFLVSSLALIVVVWIPGMPLRPEQFRLPKEVVLGLAGAVGALHLLLQAWRIRPALGAMDTAIAMALVWGVILVPLTAQNPFAAWPALGQYAAAFVLFQYARLVGEHPHRERACFGICVLLAVVALLVLLEAYGLVPFFSEPGRRAGGTLGNRNLAARLLCLGLPLFWRQLALAKAPSVRVALASGIGLLITAVVLSRSRAVWIVASWLVIALAMAIRRHPNHEMLRQRSTGLRVWGLAIVLGLVIATFAPNRLGFGASELASSAARAMELNSGTGRGRLIQMTTTWRMILANPLGVGPGNWSIAYPAYVVPGDPSFTPNAMFPAPRVPRGDVLSLTAEFGVVAVVAILGSAFVLLVIVVGALRKGTVETRYSAIMLLATVAATAALGLVDPVIRLAPTLSMFAVLVGIATGHLSENASSSISRAHSRVGARVLLAACASLSLVLSTNSVRDLIALEQIRSVSSLSDLEYAVAVAPHNEEARLLLAFVLAHSGKCDQAEHHLRAAAQLQPYSGALAAIRSGCMRRARASSREP